MRPGTSALPPSLPPPFWCNLHCVLRPPLRTGSLLSGPQQVEPLCCQMPLSLPQGAPDSDQRTTSARGPQASQQGHAQGKPLRAALRSPMLAPASRLACGVCFSGHQWPQALAPIPGESLGAAPPHSQPCCPGAPEPEAGCGTTSPRQAAGPRGLGVLPEDPGQAEGL